MPAKIFERIFNGSMPAIISGVNSNSQIFYSSYFNTYIERDVKEIDVVLEHDGILNPIEIKKTSNPGAELVRVFRLLDKSSLPREKGAVICMKPELSAIDSDNYIVPVWLI